MMSKVFTKNAAGRRRMLALALAAAVLALVPVAHGAANTPTCTAEDGQAFIEAGQYNQAVHEFTCLIEAQPTEVEGYRGRIEAKLLLGRYSDALADYARVTAFVVPVHPDAHMTIRAGYKDRLVLTPDDIPALTGASFERWANYDYPQTIHLLNRLLAAQPNGVYGNLFLGSSILLRGVTKADGAAALERAIALAPGSPDVRFIVADAYTYGQPDLQSVVDEATLALSWGLDTPRIRAILATVQNAFGDSAAAAGNIKTHIDMVTTELVTASPLTAGNAQALGLVPGRTYEIPIAAAAGGTISISTSSHDIWDSIAVLLAPDGTPVVGSDDANAYMAAFDWVAEETGTYRLLVTSFESINTGELVVTRG